ncbi:hypothetical protein CR513_13231, partial [Mucuna pruriens]
MVTEGIVLGHLILARGIKVNKAKVDIISPLSNPASMQEVQSFLSHAELQQDFPTSVQVAIEGCGLCIRLALRGRFPRAKEKTHIRAHPPSIELGVSIRAYVRPSNSALGAILGQ